MAYYGLYSHGLYDYSSRSRRRQDGCCATFTLTVDSAGQFSGTFSNDAGSDPRTWTASSTTINSSPARIKAVSSGSGSTQWQYTTVDGQSMGTTDVYVVCPSGVSTWKIWNNGVYRDATASCVLQLPVFEYQSSSFSGGVTSREDQATCRDLTDQEVAQFTSLLGGSACT